MSLKISRILHAGYVFERDHIQIAFDPIFENPFSTNCFAFPEVRFDLDEIKRLRFAAVFISHYHDDHCSLESLALLDRKITIYLFCVFEEIFILIRKLGFKNVYSMTIDVSIAVGPFEIIPRLALDADIDCILEIKAGGLNVLNVVDSWMDPDTLETFRKTPVWDVVLWPFQTMREIEVLTPTRSSVAASQLPSEWIDQLKKLKPRYIVPSSCQFIHEKWSWYNQALFPISYQQFQSEVESVVIESKVIRLNPGTSLIIDKAEIEFSDPLPWLHPVGFQDVDYDYQAHLLPPTTAEIAGRFVALNTQQTELVLRYCRIGLIEKFKSLDIPENKYFVKPRLWKLSLFNHEQAAIHFYYILKGSGIEAAQDGPESIAWLTEVPINKLYAALECGEALTSLYIRINDVIFTSEIENEIASADIMDDPLIRCLYNGVFAAYQSSQLTKLEAQQKLLPFLPEIR